MAAVLNGWLILFGSDRPLWLLSRSTHRLRFGPLRQPSRLPSSKRCALALGLAPVGLLVGWRLTYISSYVAATAFVGLAVGLVLAATALLVLRLQAWVSALR